MGIFKFAGKYDFLSLDYPCNIIVDGIVFENALRAFAAIRYSDKELQETCVACEPEVITYFLTRDRGPFIKDDFYRSKQSYLYEVLWSKFQDTQLGEKLLETGDEVIIYLSTDTEMGIKRKMGQNLLGRTLMLVREDLKKSLGIFTEDEVIKNVQDTSTGINELDDLFTILK